MNVDMNLFSKYSLKECYVKLEKLKNYDLDPLNLNQNSLQSDEDNVRKSKRVKLKNKKYDDYDVEFCEKLVNKIKEEFLEESHIMRTNSIIYQEDNSNLPINMESKPNIYENVLSDFSIILPKISPALFYHKKHFTCKHCGQDFKKFKFLKMHYQTDHPKIKTYECSECGLKFDAKDMFLHHMKTSHDKIRPFLCTLCPGKGKAFTRKQCLTTHIRVAHRDLIINQNNPNIEVTIIDGFSNNILTPTTIKKELDEIERKKIFDAENFDIKYAENLIFDDSSLNLFDMKDGKVRLKYYRCHFCGKIFNQEAHLLRHIKSVHERVKPFKCYLCPKIPPNHFATSNDEDYIGAEFTPRLVFPAGSKHTNSSAMLREHYERDPKSNYWIKSFSRKEFLIKHLRSVHQGYRPYVCDLCGMKYCDKRDMENHKKKAHCLPTENSTLVVQTCPHPQCSHIIFTSKIHLSKHIRTFHASPGSISRETASGKKVPGAAAIYLTTASDGQDDINTNTGFNPTSHNGPNDILLSKNLIAKDCSSILLTESNLLKINEEHAKNQTTHEIVNSSNLLGLNALPSSNNANYYNQNHGGSNLLINSNAYEDTLQFSDGRYNPLTIVDSIGGAESHQDILSFMNFKESLGGVGYGAYPYSQQQQQNSSFKSVIDRPLPNLDITASSVEYSQHQPNQNDMDKTSQPIMMLNAVTASSEEVLSYACEGCEKLFINRGALIRHFKSVHENHRAFICRICGRSFNQRPHLERHLSSMIHADVLKYSCDYCNRRFALKSRLEKHLFDLNYHRDPNYVRVPKYVCYICTPAEALAIGDELDFIPDDSPFTALFSEAKRKGILPISNTSELNGDENCRERELAQNYDDLYKDIDSYGTGKKRGRRRTIGFSSNEDKLLDVLTTKILKDYNHLFKNNSGETAVVLQPNSADKNGSEPNQKNQTLIIHGIETINNTTNTFTIDETLPNITKETSIDIEKEQLEGFNANSFTDEQLPANFLQFNIDDPTKSSFIKDPEIRERLLKIRQSSIVRFGRKKDLIKHLKEAHYGQLAFGNVVPDASNIFEGLTLSGNAISASSRGSPATFLEQNNSYPPSHYNNDTNHTSILIATESPVVSGQSLISGRDLTPLIGGVGEEDSSGATMGNLYLDLSNLVDNLAADGGNTIILATNDDEDGQVGGDIMNITNLNQLTPQQLEQLAIQLGQQLNSDTSNNENNTNSNDNNTNEGGAGSSDNPILAALLGSLQQQQQSNSLPPDTSNTSNNSNIPALSNNLEDNGCCNSSSVDELVKESHQQELLSKQFHQDQNVDQEHHHHKQLVNSMQFIRQQQHQFQQSYNMSCSSSNSKSLSTSNSFIISNLDAINNSLGAANQKSHIDNLKSHLSNVVANQSNFIMSPKSYSYTPPPPVNQLQNTSSSYSTAINQSLSTEMHQSQPVVSDNGLANVAAADLLLLPIYECKLCSKTFSSRLNLRRHDERTHGGEPKLNLLCEFCGKVFGFARTLRDHITSAHANSITITSTNVPNFSNPTSGFSSHPITTFEFTGIEQTIQQKQHGDNQQNFMVADIPISYNKDEENVSRGEYLSHFGQSKLDDIRTELPINILDQYKSINELSKLYQENSLNQLSPQTPFVLTPDSVQPFINLSVNEQISMSLNERLVSQMITTQDASVLDASNNNLSKIIPYS